MKMFKACKMGVDKSGLIKIVQPHYRWPLTVLANLNALEDRAWNGKDLVV